MRCRRLLQHIPAPRSLAGLDYSQKAIDFISKNLAGQFFCSEAKNIPFPDTSFDIVFSFDVFFYFENLAYAEAVLREMFRVADVPRRTARCAHLHPGCER
jgi:ubiquinone/menaquinone biosynthesis C-methylase UbiE